MDSSLTEPQNLVTPPSGVVTIGPFKAMERANRSRVGRPIRGRRHP
jgi:hypothetical protein